MTTARQPGQPDTPEQRRAKVERLLRESATWESDVPPTDFVAVAMQKQREKERKQPSLWNAWWGLSTAGVAAACVLFSFTGKMPLLESRVVELHSPSPTVPSVSQSTPAPSVANPQVTKPAPTEIRPVSGTEERGSGSSRPVRRVHRNSNRVAWEQRSLSKSPVKPTLPKNETAPTDNKGATLDAQNNNITATPTSEVYTTDDGRMLVPVVLTHTSEDGTEVSYTPAVVEMAYQPAGGAL